MSSLSDRDRGAFSMPDLIARRPFDTDIQPSDASARSLHKRSIAGSLLFHLAILAALLGLWRVAPLPDEPVVKVLLVTEGPGAAGASGGEHGGGGEAAEAASAAPAATAEAAPPQPQEEIPAPAETPPAPTAESPSLPIWTEAPSVAEALPQPPRRKPRPPQPQTAKSAPAAEPAPSPAPAKTLAEPQPTQLAAAPATTPTPGPPGSGSGPGAAAGRGTGAQGAGHGALGNGPINGPGDDYLDRLRRWLNKYKHYPEAAQKQKQEGKLVVSFTIARDGTVIDPKIERSSGFPLLDQAALKMLHDASPVPPLPDAYRADRAGVVLPVDFSIGFFDRLF